MQDILSYVGRINRPRLLSQAAKVGARDYRRDRHLPKLLGGAVLPKHADALVRLSGLEAEHDDRRRAGDTSYSVQRHVAVLIALVGEAAHLRETLAEVAAARPGLTVVK